MHRISDLTLCWVGASDSCDWDTLAPVGMQGFDRSAYLAPLMLVNRLVHLEGPYEEIIATCHARCDPISLMWGSTYRIESLGWCPSLNRSYFFCCYSVGSSHPDPFRRWRTGLVVPGSLQAGRNLADHAYRCSLPHCYSGFVACAVFSAPFHVLFTDNVQCSPLNMRILSKFARDYHKRISPMHYELEWAHVICAFAGYGK